MHRRTGLTVGLLSLTVIGLELIWMRLFSAEFYYAFAFLTLSLAVLGLGLGALALRLWPRLAGEGNLGWMLAATGAAALAGPPLVFQLGLDFSKLLTSWGQILGVRRRPAAARLGVLLRRAWPWACSSATTASRCRACTWPTWWAPGPAWCWPCCS